VELRHPDALVEEWVFTAWSPAADLGVISAHRLIGRRAWYWAALARRGHRLLHVGEWDVTVREFDPMIVKAQALWAEHTCDDPMRQWSIGNETYAAALDDPADGLHRAYGLPTPIAFDLEWYATAEPAGIADGYEQAGVVHGRLDVAGSPPIELAEVPAHRWHRWGRTLAPIALAPAVAHTGLRAAFTFPDATSIDWVLTGAGWGARSDRPSGRPLRTGYGL
jgi:hypothetical protein